MQHIGVLDFAVAATLSTLYKRIHNRANNVDQGLKLQWQS